MPRDLSRPRVSRRPPRRHARGALALAVVLLLYAAMALAVLYTHRSLVFEQRTVAHQVRAAEATEAADAGLAWAAQRLRDPRPLGADCLPARTGMSFADLHVRRDAATGAWVPRVGGVVARCVGPRGEGWRCQCPQAGTDAAPAVDGPGFDVRLEPGARASLLDVAVTGCSRASTRDGCGPESGVTLTATFANRPLLAATPTAALVARGRVVARAGALGVHNGDTASGGVALRAGQGVDALALRVTGPAGSPPGQAVVAADPVLQAAGADVLYLSWFGMPRGRWRDAQADVVLDCPCDVNTVAAAAGQGARTFWLRGPLEGGSGAVLGSADAPLLVVVDGPAALPGGLQFHGVLHARELSWAAGARGGLLRGAAVSEGDYRGDGAPDIVYDRAVIDRLRAQPGAFVRVPGSWRDAPAAR